MKHTVGQQRVGGVGESQLAGGGITLVGSDRAGRLVDDVNPASVGVNGEVAGIRALGSSKVLNLGDFTGGVVVGVHPNSVAHVVGRVDEVVVRAHVGSVDTGGAVVRDVRSSLLKDAIVVDGDG